MWASCKRLSRQLLGSFLQPPCPICGRSISHLFCRDCQRQIQGCQLLSPYRHEAVAVPTFAWGSYTGTLKRAIQMMKYQNNPDVAIYLGQLLGQVWSQQGPSFLSSSPLTQNSPSPSAGRHLTNMVVVPIPLHQDRLKERGYNQAALIAQGFCQVVKVPCLEKGLLRVRGTEAQHRLGAQARQKNINGAFRLGPDWSLDQISAPVLLLDDIYTTGTTANAAATELRRNGIRVVGIGLVARAILERPGSKKSGVTQPLAHQRLSLDRVP